MQRLLSPICLSEYSCPSISRKRRTGESSRARQSKRLCSSRGLHSSWALAPQHRFFDKSNWMDDADKQIAEMPEDLSTWRDAYTVMISRPRTSTRSRRGQTGESRRQRRTTVASAPYTLISLPVCPPMDHPSTPRTPGRGRTTSTRIVFPEATSAVVI